MVDEPTVDETIDILKGLRDRYEAHHRVKITDEALVAAARLSARYISDRFLPDKAIDLLDEAGSKVRLSGLVMPPALKELEAQIEEVRIEKESAIKNEEFEKPPHSVIGNSSSGMNWKRSGPTGRAIAAGLMRW